MSNRHEVSRNRRFEIFKKMIINFVIWITLMVFVGWGFYFVVESVTKEVKKVGLKNIVSEFWEGEKK